MLNERKLTKAELKKREDIIMNMKKNKRSLVRKYGKDAEKVLYGRATKLAKSKNENMDKNKLREAIKSALLREQDIEIGGDKYEEEQRIQRAEALLSMFEDKLKRHDWWYQMSSWESGGWKKGSESHKDLENLRKELKNLGYGDEAEELYKKYEQYSSIKFDESKNSFPDLTGDGKVTKADILKGRGVDLDEDLDLGHQDNEPHMLKGDLYRIAKYAMELYQIVDKFEYGHGEVDFPHWWQSKIIKAKEMMVSAKHYLDFELKEPEIDSMIGNPSIKTTPKDIEIEEGMSEEEWAKAKEEDRLEKLPLDQRLKIKQMIAMLKAEKKNK